MVYLEGKDAEKFLEDMDKPMPEGKLEYLEKCAEDSIKAEARGRGETEFLPSYLDCPFCPAQSYLKERWASSVFVKYECPTKHKFYLRENE